MTDAQRPRTEAGPDLHTWTGSILDDVARHLDAHGCECVWRLAIFDKAHKAEAATLAAPAGLREALGVLDAERERAHNTGEHEYERGLEFMHNPLVAAIEAEASLAAPAGLRETLDAMASQWEEGAGSDPTHPNMANVWRQCAYELRAALEAAPRSPEPDFVERLARAMEPTWFEDVTALPRPATLSDHDWGQMVLDVHLRRERAIKRAAEIATRLGAAPVRLIDAAAEVVRLGNQPGMDDDEWEAAMTALEAALEAAPRSPEPTYGDCRCPCYGCRASSHSEV